MAKKIYLIIPLLIILLISIAFVPKSVFAACASSDPCPGGIVPCGRTCDDDTTANDECSSCTICHFFMLIQRAISQLLVPLSMSLVALMALVAGILFITASGDPGRIATARKVLTSAIVGLSIVLLSWLIVNTIVGFATGSFKNGAGTILNMPWNKITCTVP